MCADSWDDESTYMLMQAHINLLLAAKLQHAVCC
jgi:hypothetical protein